MKRALILGAAGAGFAAVGYFVMGSNQPAQAVTLQAENPMVVLQGSQIYQNNCASCHGANRIVIPELKQSQLNKFRDGTVTLDQMTKKFIRTKLEYQYLLVDRSQDAYDLENHCRSGAIFGRKPLLNPISA